MPKTTGFANSMMLLLLNATAITNVADNAASAPLTNTYLSLHTASPGTSADQTTNETTYTSYARVPVARSGSGWTVSGGVGTLAANADFPSCTGGTATITYYGIGSAASGTGVLWYYGAVSPSISVSTGVIPRLTTGTTVTET